MQIIKVNKREDFKSKTRTGRMYFWPQGEKLLENLANRRTRPYNEYRKLIKEALLQAGYTEERIKGMKPRWSQKAGCSCPCSPGFIVDGLPWYVDVHVTVGSNEQVAA